MINSILQNGFYNIINSMLIHPLRFPNTFVDWANQDKHKEKATQFGKRMHEWNVATRL